MGKLTKTFPNSIVPEQGDSEFTLCALVSFLTFNLLSYPLVCVSQLILSILFPGLYVTSVTMLHVLLTLQECHWKKNEVKAVRFSLHSKRNILC